MRALNATPADGATMLPGLPFVSAWGFLVRVHDRPDVGHPDGHRASVCRFGKGLDESGICAGCFHLFGYIIDNWELPFLGRIELLLLGSIVAFWMKPGEKLSTAQLRERPAVSVVA